MYFISICWFNDTTYFLRSYGFNRIEVDGIEKLQWIFLPFYLRLFNGLEKKETTVDNNPPQDDPNGYIAYYNEASDVQKRGLTLNRLK